MATNHPDNYLSALAVVVTLADINQCAKAVRSAEDAHGWDSTDWDHATDALCDSIHAGLFQLSMLGLSDAFMEKMDGCASALERRYGIK